MYHPGATLRHLCVFPRIDRKPSMQPSDEPTRHTYPTGQYGTPASYPQQFGPQEYRVPRPPKKRRGMLVAAAAIGAVALLGGGVLAGLALKDAPSSPAPAAAPSTTSPSCDPGRLVLAGCDGQAAPAPTTPAALPTSFSNARELVDALNGNGLACGPSEQIANPSLADSLIDCGQTVVAAVYSQAGAAESGFDLLVNTHKTLAAGAPWSVHMAVGSNWTVNADEAYARKAAGLFGGEYRTASG
jgi:hypothetical protein